MFTLLFTPILGGCIYFTTNEADLPIPIAFVYLCAAAPVLILLCISFSMMQSSKPQVWMVDEDFISYDSPTSFLGDSFKMPISDFSHVTMEDESDFAFCVSTSGKRMKFHVGNSEGSRFFRHLKSEQKIQSNKPAHPTAGNVLL